MFEVLSREAIKRNVAETKEFVTSQLGTELTQAEYNALSEYDRNHGLYYITDGISTQEALILSGVISAGETCFTFQIPTSGDYLIDFYTDNGLCYKSLDTSIAGRVTIEYPVQQTDMNVYCKIEGVAHDSV